MITKNLIRVINADVQEALKAVAERHGVKISLGSTSYSKAEYSTKLIVKSPDADKVSGEESKQYAHLLGLPEDVIGRKFTLQGKEFEVIRLDLAKPKNPVIIRKPGTESPTYKISVDTLKRNANIQ
jgi:hypothetical protein